MNSASSAMSNVSEKPRDNGAGYYHQGSWCYAHSNAAECHIFSRGKYEFTEKPRHGRAASSLVPQVQVHRVADVVEYPA
jgi:hypothetical protein